MVILTKDNGSEQIIRISELVAIAFGKEFD
jgi:hypothetical protein